jgi:hypothetical protein
MAPEKKIRESDGSGDRRVSDGSEDRIRVSDGSGDRIRVTDGSGDRIRQDQGE